MEGGRTSDVQELGGSVTYRVFGLFSLVAAAVNSAVQV